MVRKISRHQGIKFTMLLLIHIFTTIRPEINRRLKGFDKTPEHGPFPKIREHHSINHSMIARVVYGVCDTKKCCYCRKPFYTTDRES